MFRLDSHLIPLPTPGRAERVEAPITTTSARIIAILVNGPSSFIIHFDPVTLNTPEANCDTPYPKVTDIPRMVAMIETMSITCPRGPDSSLPKIGVRPDRMVGGRPRE